MNAGTPEPEGTCPKSPREAGRALTPQVPFLGKRRDRATKRDGGIRSLEADSPMFH
jgi:hypothetical protein